MQLHSAKLASACCLAKLPVQVHSTSQESCRWPNRHSWNPRPAARVRQPGDWVCPRPCVLMGRVFGSPSARDAAAGMHKRGQGRHLFANSPSEVSWPDCSELRRGPLGKRVPSQGYRPALSPTRGGCARLRSQRGLGRPSQPLNLYEEAVPHVPSQKAQQQGTL